MGMLDDLKFQLGNASIPMVLDSLEYRDRQWIRQYVSTPPMSVFPQSAAELQAKVRWGN